jgi:hypothetical protein
MHRSMLHGESVSVARKVHAWLDLTSEPCDGASELHGGSVRRAAGARDSARDTLSGVCQ